MNQYCVYILANQKRGTLYIGVTNDLNRRVFEHKQGLIKGFTQKYNVHKLVYYEETSEVMVAIAREKELKKWRREKKNHLTHISHRNHQMAQSSSAHRLCCNRKWVFPIAR